MPAYRASTQMLSNLGFSDNKRGPAFIADNLLGHVTIVRRQKAKRWMLFQYFRLHGCSM